MLKGLKKHPYLSALLLLALGARIYFEVTYIDFNMDKARQLFIAQCFLEGDGFSFCTADLSDLSRITCHRIKYWAIGNEQGGRDYALTYLRFEPYLKEYSGNINSISWIFRGSR